MFQPPWSTLPLKWKSFNQCREMDEETRAANLRIAPLNSFDEFIVWLYSLSMQDHYAWFTSIGWPEGSHCCLKYNYLEKTGYPALLKDLERYQRGDKCLVEI